MCEINGTFNASSRASGLNVMFLIYVSAILKGLGHETACVAFSCGTKKIGAFSLAESLFPFGPCSGNLYGEAS
jgi:hypothetical protein